MKLANKLNQMGLQNESYKVSGMIKEAQSLGLEYNGTPSQLQSLFVVVLEEYYNAVDKWSRDFYDGDDDECARRVVTKAFEFFNKAEITPDLPKEIIKEIAYWECPEGFDTWFGYNSLFKAMALGGKSRNNWPFYESGGDRVQLAWTLFVRENERRWRKIEAEKALEEGLRERSKERKPHINDAERPAPAAPTPADGEPDEQPTTPQNPWGDMIRHPSPHR